eukprot:9496414-Pyramimonas_sp.AAC.1
MLISSGSVERSNSNKNNSKREAAWDEAFHKTFVQSYKDENGRAPTKQRVDGVRFLPRYLCVMVCWCEG